MQQLKRENRRSYILSSCRREHLHCHVTLWSWRACLGASHCLLLQVHTMGNLRAVFAVQTCCRSSRAQRSKRESPPRMCCCAAPRCRQRNSPSGSSPMPSIWCTDNKAAARYLRHICKQVKCSRIPIPKERAGSRPRNTDRRSQIGHNQTSMGATKSADPTHFESASAAATQL
jgi:hypothetical protein